MTNEGHVIVDERRAVYGDAIPTFTRIAQVWSGILDHEVSAFEVALCMNGLKAVRAAVCPDYSDNTDDMDGYVKLAREIVGPDMIHARSVDDYVEQKRARS